jgi:predicted transcriptional regulator of viral defense system
MMLNVSMNSISDIPMESVRLIDRAVLDVARTRKLRPMEAYLLMALDDHNNPATTAEMAERIAASTSQTKQVALRMQERGFVERIGWTGVTVITPKGSKEAQWLRSNIAVTVEKRTS